MKVYFYKKIRSMSKKISPSGLVVSIAGGVLKFFYMPMQLVAPSAVTIAVATDAIICTININVSLFVIMFN